MSTLKQVEANRLNASRSTGPRSAVGKAAVRFNALKSGIHAKSQVLPGEDPKALDALTAEYYDRFQPATPEVRALVDSLITAEWLQRRFRTLEAQLWNLKIEELFRPQEGFEVAQAYDLGSHTFDRLQRRIDCTLRNYQRALKALETHGTANVNERPDTADTAAALPIPVGFVSSPPLAAPEPAARLGFVPSIPPRKPPFDLTTPPAWRL